MLCACQPEETRVRLGVISCSMRFPGLQEAHSGVAGDGALQPLPLLADRFPALPAAPCVGTHLARGARGIS